MLEPIILPSVRDELVCRGKNLELANGQYIYDSENKNTAFIRNKFMEADSKCWDILNISSGIFSVIMKSYQAGVGNPTIDYDIYTNIIMEGLVANGISAIELISDGENQTLEAIPSDEIFFDKDIPMRIRYFEIEENSKTQYYLFTKTYFVGYNENKLYRLASKNSLNGKEISLDSLYITENFQDREETGLNTISISIIEDQAVFSIVKSLVYAIERKLVVSDNEIIQFVKTKILAINTGVKTETADDDIWITNNETADVKFIKQNNPYLQDSLNYIETQIRLISAITKIPVGDFGLEDSGTGTGENAQIIKKSAYVKEMVRYRDMIEKAIRELIADVSIFWDDIVVEDKKTTLEVITLAKAEGIITQIQAIQMFWGVNKKEAEMMYNTLQSNLNNNASIQETIGE